MFKIGKEHLTDASKEGIITSEQSEKLYEYLKKRDEKEGYNLITIIGIIVSIMAYIGLMGLTISSDNFWFITIVTSFSVVAFHYVSKFFNKNNSYVLFSFFDTFSKGLLYFLIYYIYDEMFFSSNDSFINIINLFFLGLTFWMYKRSKQPIHFSQGVFMFVISINYFIIDLFGHLEGNGLVYLNTLFSLSTFLLLAHKIKKGNIDMKIVSEINTLNAFYFCVIVFGWIEEVFRGFEPEHPFILISSIGLIIISFIMQSRAYLLGGVIYLLSWIFFFLDDHNVDTKIVVFIFLLISAAFVYFAKHIVKLEEKYRPILFKDNK